ncbi:hypothetical protein DQ04_03301090 [Trypanosoma grayi]|uniref:hypothetical protein n=1 Tax=Trypanosoma grayi TaxID=71804 RepID=UPI0004F40F4D|nr:hypothetical protein DQ04_03301090 [Trypanosoma grayi]KEG10781.1 hypothetical protein DQ04_03301090 [Trypanosoma grayi]
MACAVVAVLFYLLMHATAYADQCSSRPIYYASECLAMDGCSWCCERPVGSQCFDNARGSDSSFAVCSENATLSNPNTTCGQLCATAIGDCGTCEQKNWCYFCIGSSLCQAPYATCLNGEVIQSCSMLKKPAGSDLYYFKVLIYVGGALIGIAVLASFILLWLRVRQRMREDHQTLADEGRPFLNSNTHTESDSHNNIAGGGGGGGAEANTVDSEAPDAEPEAATGPPPAEEREGGRTVQSPRSAKASTADDDSLCFLCLEASPAVTFLPCYHTCCCEACSNKLRPTRADTLTCPFCRARIVAMVSLHSILLQAASPS